MSKAVSGNGLLDGLPPGDRDRLLPALEPIVLTQGQVIYRSQYPIRTVYFPQHAVCAFVAELEDGATVEVGMIGCEGAVGTAVLLGARTSHYDCIVQSTGSALALSSDILLRHAETSPSLRYRLLRFIQASTFHTAQSAACAARHGLQKRCARW